MFILISSKYLYIYIYYICLNFNYVLLKAIKAYLLYLYIIEQNYMFTKKKRGLENLLFYCKNATF